MKRLSAIITIFMLSLLCAACEKYTAAYESDGNSDGDADKEISDGEQTESETAENSEAADEGMDYPPGPYGSEIGDVMADWTLYDCDGKEVSLSDYYGQAAAVLINSSAGWCTYCRRETPKLEEWYKEYADDGLVILQALFENNAAKAADAAFCASWRDQYELTYPVLVDPEKIFSDYYLVPGQTSGTPLSVVLDDEMKIRFKHEGDISDSILERIIDLLAEDR